MTSFDKTLYVQRLLFQLQQERKQVTRDKETDSLVLMYEVAAAKALDNVVENLQEALTTMGFFPAFRER